MSSKKNSTYLKFSWCAYIPKNSCYREMLGTRSHARICGKVLFFHDQKENFSVCENITSF